MTDPTLNLKMEINFGDAEQRALTVWTDAQQLDADLITNAPYGRSLTKAADGSELEGFKFCDNGCGMKFKSAPKGIIAECVRLDCDGTENMRSSVQAVAQRAAEITDAYKLFIES